MRNMNRTGHWISWFVVVGFCLAVFGSAGSKADEKDDRLARLAERVEAIEKLVIKDPFHPDNTVLARLETVEQKAREFDKTAGKDAKADDRALDEVRKSVKDSQRDMEQFERRMKTVEQEKRGGGDAADVKELKRDIDRLQTAVEALKDRVSKLESKR